MGRPSRAQAQSDEAADADVFNGGKLKLTEDDKRDPWSLSAKGKRSLNQLIQVQCDYTRDRKRTRELVLFAARPMHHPGQEKPITFLKYDDRPEIELIVHHAREVSRLELTVERLSEEMNKLNDATPAQIQSIAENMVSLQQNKFKHTEAIEKILANLSKEQMGREQMMVKITTDAAKLVQAAYQHKDKMDLAERNSDIQTSDDLKAVLAQKYNVPVDQVDAILKAKSAEVPPNG